MVIKTLLYFISMETNNNRYIHGAQNTSHYLALDPSFKNPADDTETNGLKLTIDTWNSQFKR